MGEEIEFENGRISDFHGLLTLTLDPGMVITFFISHRVLPVYQISSKSKKLFVDRRTHGRKFATHSIRSTSKVCCTSFFSKHTNQQSAQSVNILSTITLKKHQHLQKFGWHSGLVWPLCKNMRSTSADVTDIHHTLTFHSFCFHAHFSSSD